MPRPPPAADVDVRAPLRWLVGLAVLVCCCAPGSLPAADPDTVSPAASYQYLDSPDELLTNLFAASSIASYQHYDSVDELLTNFFAASRIVSYQFFDSPDELTNELFAVSPIVSYQYYDWPGDEVDLHFASSPAVSYYFYGAAPSITQQPRSQSVRTGTTVTLSVAAQGSGLLSYQWQRNGTDVPGGTAPTLELPGTTPADSGDYQVMVRTGVGSVWSRVAKLLVYVPPSGPPPPVPTLQPAAQQPAPSLVGRKPLPLPEQLKVFSEDTTIDPNSMTIVLTHGLNSSSDSWPREMAAKLWQQTNANILAWDWRENARGTGIPLLGGSFNPDAPLYLTAYEGRALSAALLQALGTGYSQPIHFIGHSLGTILNAHCANYLHAHGFYWERTHMTLFDEAEVANWLPRSLDPAEYHRPTPRCSKWVDSYLSEVSYAELIARRQEAVFVLLPGLRPVAHGYPYVWYGNTIDDPGVCEIGFRYSFELQSLAEAPRKGTVYVQRRPDDAFAFDRFGPGEDYWPALLKYSERKAYSVYVKTVVQPLEEVRDAIVSAGENAVDWVEDKAQAVSDWTLRVILRKQPSGSPSPLLRSLAALAPETNLSAYVWVPITISNTVAGMSLEFAFQDTAEGDYLVVGINDTNLFTFETSFVTNGAQVSSGIVDVSPWAGQQVELFLGLMGSGSTNGSVSIEGIHFYDAAPPPLTITRTNETVAVAWPALASKFVLESATNLAGSSAWSTVTNLPALVQEDLVVTNTVSEGARFYRLRYSPGR